jgi:hypothetical protein
LDRQQTTRLIIDEIYRAFVLLGAESDLLGLVGSWRDSLSAQHVLEGLSSWNDATLAEIKGRIEHYETTCPHLACNQAGDQKRFAPTQ